MTSLTDFLRCYNTRDAVAILKAIQIMIASNHNKDISMLKFGRKQLYLANIRLHKFTDSKFHPFTELYGANEKKLNIYCWDFIYCFYSLR